jgi:hypothetical protein
LASAIQKKGEDL